MSKTIEDLHEELSKTIDKFMKDTGCEQWVDSPKLECVTANFSDCSPRFHLGCIPFQRFVSDCKEIQAKINQIRTKEQAKAEALSSLKEAIAKATESGLFDELAAYCGNPDSINDVCDAVASVNRHYYYYSWVVSECFRENENDNGLRHTTIVSYDPPKEFLASLLNGWVEIRQFPSEEKLEEFAKTVGLGR
jgi:hypothetical protein